MVEECEPDRVTKLEGRVSALESSNDPCSKGHLYAQGHGIAERVIFCQKCGKSAELVDSGKNALGFKAEG